MAPTLQLAAHPNSSLPVLFLIRNSKDLAAAGLSTEHQQVAENMLAKKATLFFLSVANAPVIAAVLSEKNSRAHLKEATRQAGFAALRLLRDSKITEIQLADLTGHNLLAELAEGLYLSDYTYSKFKAEPADGLRTIVLTGNSVSENYLNRLRTVLEATAICRDLVNEPGNTLTAVKLSEELTKLGKKAGFAVEVLNKAKLKALKMGGLLSVNLGSQDPPTFSILEYKPKNAVNSQPIVLVGKGVTYDTGGLSLKPTPASMDMMKCDMAGAAAVAATLYALAKNQDPLHVIGLIPATDNRPGEKAIAPGDVIKMYSGKTVEVLNTDAEGRLLLADALCWASKYQPALVIDLATLTGAAARAIGKEAIVCMGTATEQVKTELKTAGDDVYERLVEFPLWEEYGKQLESDIADLKNLGGPDAGAITAGKFLEAFTDYPWMHLDIAGTAYLTATDSYRGKNATGSGVRLLYQFLTARLSN